MFDCGALIFIVWAFFTLVLCDEYITEGGTTLYDVPEQIIVVLPPIDKFFEPKPDCVAVYIGGFNPERNQGIALTSPYCEISFFEEVRTARQEIIPASMIHYEPEEFHIGVIQMQLEKGDWEPEIGIIEKDKNKIRRELNEGSENRHQIGYGFAANADPILAYTVSLNQTDCPRLFKELRRISWPEELPEGVFCVFEGREQGYAHDPFLNHPILPAVPCDDAMGSPILFDDFVRILGIIIYTNCDEKNNVAFAVSPAYLPPVDVPTTQTAPRPTTTTTTSSTMAPPPLPRIPATSRPCADLSTAAVNHHHVWSYAICGAIQQINIQFWRETS